MQRRDFFRQPIPASISAQCYVPTANRSDESAIPIVDISYGGLGLLGIHPDFELDSGQLLRGCRVELGSLGIIHCDLLIGSQSAVTLKNGIATVRTSCKFQHLTSNAKNLLQRFIFLLEQQSLNSK
ncbi:PilZ domain-containing protein [Chitinibacter fontanus]|uniref:PilZ domain-containing protein n=1 Tax=Chitinibacter fontanus TaxID=1737446 RepID=A0A7D5VB07_9NEIS|nr:PilZ domain-containing protein [Chitinibacter fontanus]